MDAEENFYLSGVHAGVYSVSKFAPTVIDDAAFVSRTGATGVYAGHEFYAQYTMRNTSSITWTPANGFSFVTINPRGNTIWGSNKINWPAGVKSVPPNGTITFTGLMTAPLTANTYSMQLQMEHYGHLFGQPTPSTTITVYNGGDNADFVSQTGVVTSVGPGRTFNATITMKNIGVQPWNTSLHKLLSVGPSNFGVPSISAGATALGGSFAFSATFTAPSTPGIYSFQYRMADGATYFGRSAPQVFIAVSADASQFVSYAGASGWYAGSDFYPTFTMRNTGTTTWTQASGYSLIALNPYGNTTFGVNRLLVPSSATVAPGSTVGCVNLCTAPAYPGCYVFQWQMAKNGIPFGEKTPYMIVTSYRGSDDSYFVRYDTTIPTSIQHGQTFNTTIIFANMGLSNWNSGYTLAPVGNGFGFSSIPLSSANPNTQPFTWGYFQGTFTAPSTPGLYKFQWRMMHGGKWMGQISTPVTIKVT